MAGSRGPARDFFHHVDVAAAGIVVVAAAAALAYGEVRPSVAISCDRLSMNIAACNVEYLSSRSGASCVCWLCSGSCLVR